MREQKKKTGGLITWLDWLLDEQIKTFKPLGYNLSLKNHYLIFLKNVQYVPNMHIHLKKINSWY